MELAESDGESLRLGHPTPLPQQLARLAPPRDLPRPPATRGVGAGGGKMRRVVEDGGGEGKVSGSQARSGGLAAGWVCRGFPGEARDRDASGGV